MMQELTDAICSLADGKPVGPDGVSVELFEITLNGDPGLLRRLLDIVFRIWGKGGGAAALGKRHHGTTQEEGSDRFSRWYCTPEIYCWRPSLAALVSTARAWESCRKNRVISDRTVLPTM